MKAPSDQSEALMQVDVPGLSPHRGKVRDTFDTDKGLVMVTTDRISAFDWVLQNGIPDKGRVLNQMSLFAFKQIRQLIPELRNHLITSDVTEFGPAFQGQASQLEGRSILAKKYTVLPAEMIVRGYLAGSWWEAYTNAGSGERNIHGFTLPDGMRESEEFAHPLFTPSTKAERGQHDENISFDQLVVLIGGPKAEQVRTTCLRIYSEARAKAAERGIIIADTKFEIGEDDSGNLILIDEVLTPDSSRFWPADQYQPGKAQRSYDKQFVRDWLQFESGWKKKSGQPPPPLPEHIVRQTQEKYIEAHDHLTGEEFKA